MTAKNLSFTTIQKEDGYMGAGTGDVLVLALQEPLDVSSLVRESIEDTTIRSSVWDSGNGPSIGLRQGELSLVLDLPGLAANDGGAVTNDAEGDIIASAVGSYDAATGTTAADVSPTTTVFDVTSAAGLAPTNMILVETSAGYRVAPILSIDSAELTLAVPLPAAPASDNDVIAGVTYTPSETRTTWILEHHEDNDALGYKCQGVHFVPQISNIGATEGKARLTLPCTIGDWEHIPSTIASATPPDTFTRPGTIQDNGWFILTDGTDAITCIASTFNVENLLTAMRRADACKQNVVGEPEILPSADKAITTELWQPAGATTDPVAQLRKWFEEGTMLKCLYQVGCEPTDCIAFYFPAVYLSQEPKEVDKGGIMAIAANLKISLDRNSTVFDRPWYMARF